MRFRYLGVACAVFALAAFSTMQTASADEFSVPNPAENATGADSSGLGLSPTGRIGIEDNSGVAAPSAGVGNSGVFTSPGSVTPGTAAGVPATGFPTTGSTSGNTTPGYYTGTPAAPPSNGGYYSGAYEDAPPPEGAAPADGAVSPPVSVPMEGAPVIEGGMSGGYVESYPMPMEGMPMGGMPMDGGMAYPAPMPAPAMPYAAPYAENYVAPAPVEPAAPAPVLQRRTAAPSSNVVGTTNNNCQPACGQKRDDCCFAVDRCGRRYGCTTIRVEGLFSYLDSPEGLVGTPAFGNPQQWEWDQLDYEPSFGGRAFVKHCLGPLEWIEVGGTYYGSWDDEITSTGVFGFAPPDAFAAGGHIPIGESNPVAATFSSEAEAFGGEASFITEMHCSGCYRWDWLVGARYLQFNEEARIDFAQAPIAGIGAGGPGAFVASDVENTFIGLQIGAVMHWELSPTFELQASLKGLAGNLNRDLTVTDNDIFSGGMHTATSEEDEVVFGADIDIGARWRITNRLTLTAGYNLLFLDGVSRANDAMDFSKANSGAVQAQHETDQLLIHSVFVGLEVNF